jgi:hypothetical protein
MDNLCAPLLENGLYKTFHITQQSDFASDFKTYLESSTFKKDFKDKKWNLGIDVIVDGIPIGLKGGESDNEINDFQNTVKTGQSLKLEEHFYLNTSQSMPDVELAKVYTECVLGFAGKFGFIINANVSEKSVFFLINYRPLNIDDPMPLVKDFRVNGGKNIVANFKIGEKLIEKNTVSCDRDGDQDILLLLSTDKGSLPYRVPGNPSGFNKDFPVGTIITSYLKWAEFQKVTKNNLNNPDGDIFNSVFSKWAPCDGREVDKTCGFIRAIGDHIKLPDLRGLFLRGRNIIDESEADHSITPVNDDQKDPDNRIRGIFQTDDLKAHTHEIETNATGGNKDGVMRVANALPRPIISSSTGGSETRPKNMAIFYYIRIN